MSLEDLEKELGSSEKEEKKVISEDRKKELYSKVVKFTSEIRKRFGDLVKSVLIFGSFVRGDIKPTSDVDVWVILDDTATKSSEDLEKIVARLHLIAREIGDLHVQTTGLTEFWDWIKKGSPELVSFLRYGLVIYDTGFVKPIQRMLEKGLLPPSEETISLKAKVAETRLKKIKGEIASMIFDLRYAVLDIVQAVIMHFYKEQTDAKGSIKFLEKMVEEGKIEKEYLDLFKEIDKIWKDIDHKIKEASVDDLKRAYEIANKIVDKFKELIPKDILEVF
ncbi:MAG: hypothetical protein B6U78_00585 [Candidatus Aenigmarchaeota archaeon ex4484_224]|nr:MAG: hypothetical protein B6U78_00585 [Candidatus Aenigmarchaeota archaeon ex4484_224]